MPTRLTLFDFDGTTFRSPRPPADWPDELYWYGDLASLTPPAIPAIPGPEWWVEETIEAMGRAWNGAFDLALMATGRGPEFEPVIRGLLDGKGIDMPQLDCRPEGMATIPFKTDLIRFIVNDGTGVEVVEVWEDRPENLEAFDTVQLGEQRLRHARRTLAQDLARTVYQLMTEGR